MENVFSCSWWKSCYCGILLLIINNPPLQNMIINHNWLAFYSSHISLWELNWQSVNQIRTPMIVVVIGACIFHIASHVSLIGSTQVRSPGIGACWGYFWNNLRVGSHGFSHDHPSIMVGFQVFVSMVLSFPEVDIKLGYFTGTFHVIGLPANQSCGRARMAMMQQRDINPPAQVIQQMTAASRCSHQLVLELNQWMVGRTPRPPERTPNGGIRQGRPGVETWGPSGGDVSSVLTWPVLLLLLLLLRSACCVWTKPLRHHI